MANFVRLLSAFSAGSTSVTRTLHVCDPINKSDRISWPATSSLIARRPLARPTFRMLQSSRPAMAFALGSDVSSSSQRHSRPIGVTNVARFRPNWTHVSWRHPSGTTISWHRFPMRFKTQRSTRVRSSIGSDNARRSRTDLTTSAPISAAGTRRTDPATFCCPLQQGRRDRRAVRVNGCPDSLTHLLSLSSARRIYGSNLSASKTTIIGAGVYGAVGVEGMVRIGDDIQVVERGALVRVEPRHATVVT